MNSKLGSHSSSSNSLALAVFAAACSALVAASTATAATLFWMERREQRRRRPRTVSIPRKDKEEDADDVYQNSDDDDGGGRCRCFQDHLLRRRERLPSLVLLVRHGESEGNADHTLYRTRPDNLVELTDAGIEQAKRTGERIERIFRYYDGPDDESGGDAGAEKKGKKRKMPRIRRVHLTVSPFERTLQTAAALRTAFEHRIVRTNVQPRIREQEFGNLQRDDFQLFRAEQKRVGRFWYRFPTGESGADVYDRVTSWWRESVLTVNERPGYDRVDAVVVVTHGLTMRFVLMQLYNWSPTTFHSVWNADNCSVYALKKDLALPGRAPYVLDDVRGDMPKSSIDIRVEFASSKKQTFRLHDYLRIPPPRTRRGDIVKRKLAEQYPDDIDEANDPIVTMAYVPFVDGALVTAKSSYSIHSAAPESSAHSWVTSSSTEDDSDPTMAKDNNSSEEDVEVQGEKYRGGPMSLTGRWKMMEAPTTGGSGAGRTNISRMPSSPRNLAAVPVIHTEVD